MYDRHIDVKQNLVFIDRVNYVSMELFELPKNVTFYVEFLGDWWIEREPFLGQEKNEDIRHISLMILADAEKLWAEKQAATKEE
jgi:hypothetical protein